MSAEDCVGCRHINNCLGDCVGYEKVKPHEQTNEEWLRSCTTEQLAEFLADKCNEAVDWILYEVDEHAGNIEPDDYWYRKDAFVEWLKEVHHDNP